MNRHRQRIADELERELADAGVAMPSWRDQLEDLQARSVAVDSISPMHLNAIRTALRRRSFAPLMFRNTIVARMLRTLCDAGTMTQAKFMSLYHVRCERAHPSRSSFQNQFARFTGPRLFCMRQERPRLAFSPHKLVWRGGSRAEVFALLTDEELFAAEQLLERQCTIDARKTDDVNETASWYQATQDAARARADEIVSVALAAHDERASARQTHAIEKRARKRTRASDAAQSATQRKRKA